MIVVALYLFVRLLFGLLAITVMAFIAVAYLAWMVLCAIANAIMDPATWSKRYRRKPRPRDRPRVPPAPRNPRNPRMYYSTRR